MKTCVRFWDSGSKNLCHTSRAFSRVYAILAKTEIPERTQIALVNRFIKDRGLSSSLLDASAIKARKKTGNTRKSVMVKVKRKRERTKKGQPVPSPELSGVARYLPMTPPEMNRALSPVCSWGGRTSPLLPSDRGIGARHQLLGSVS
jgi:hypothetical protein